MALPLTVFKTISDDVPLADTVIYTAPVGYNTIVLLAQTCNASAAAASVTFEQRRNGVDIPIVYQYEIPESETLPMVQRLVLETNDSLVIHGTSTDLKYIVSLLETLK